MKKALIHDFLSVCGGAEKCVESFTNIWDDIDVYSLVDYLSEEDRARVLKGKYAHTSFITKLPLTNKYFRYYFPLFPKAVERFDLSDYDLVLSSSHSAAKGVLTRPDQLHICYIYTPPRYLWDFYDSYRQSYGIDKGIKGIAAEYFLNRMRKWDIDTADRPNHYIAISKYVAERVHRIYGRQADIIYPPVDTDRFDLGTCTDSYYITSSRLVPYKRIDMIANAFTLSGKKLVIIGDGPQMEKIRKAAGKNIEIMGRQNQETIIELTKKAKAFIFAAEEDFGIAPLEAQACGVPVIAYGRGGALETINGYFVGTRPHNGATGIFFREQTVNSLNSAVACFEGHIDLFDKRTIRENSLRFGRQRFENEIQSYIENKLDELK